MYKIIILASVFMAVSCADQGAKKKKKSPVQAQQTEQQNYSQNTQPGSADGMLGTIQNQQNQNSQSQSNANPLAGILGGLNDPNYPLSGLLQQFLGGGAGGALNPQMLQSLLGGGGAGGLDISKLMQMFPQMQGMNIGGLINQSGAKTTGLRGDDTDPSLFALVDFLASEYLKRSGTDDRRAYKGVEIVCLSSQEAQALISVYLSGDSQRFYGTRSVSCSKFKIVFTNLEDGDYDLRVSLKNLADESQQDIELSVSALGGQISEHLDF